MCEEEGHLGRDCPDTPSYGTVRLHSFLIGRVYLRGIWLFAGRRRLRRFVEVDDRGTYSVEIGSNPFEMTMNDEDKWAGDPLSITPQIAAPMMIDDEIEDGQLESSP